MNITIIGTGYVGLTTGICFAELGNTVTCLDIDTQKIERLSKGECVIYEKDLPELLQKNLESKNIFFTTDAASAMKDAQIVFFTIQTPQGEYGKADLTYLFRAAEQYATLTTDGTLFVNKSTAPVGSAAKLKKIIQKARGNDHFLIASCPEFLKEGVAVHDFFHPDRVIVGTEDARAEELLRTLHAPLTDEQHPIVNTSVQSAELIKYASNTFLALKISFINEVADFCEYVGADIKEISKGIGYDTRIGHRFLDAGIGYGGSCFGKDVKALAISGEERGFEFKIIKSLVEVNERRYQVVLRKLRKHFSSLESIRITVLGLAYKGGTDDVRDAQSLRIIQELLELGGSITAYDPAAIDTFKKAFSKSDQVTFGESAEAASIGADVILILTDWEEFASLDFAKIKERAPKATLLVDGRNMFERKTVESFGLIYEGVGR